MQNINLENIKIVIFDFDNTLAMHKDKDFIIHRESSEDNYLGYYLNAYQNPENFYDDIEVCEKSDVLYSLVGELRKRNIKMYCMSAMKFSFHLKAKQNFVNKHYGDDIEVISVASWERKVLGVKIIQRFNKCKLDEILFIDDSQDVINSLRENGIKAILVDDVKSC